MGHRIEVKSKIGDTPSQNIKKFLEHEGFAIGDIEIIEVYTLDNHFSNEELIKIGEMLTNPITHEFKIDIPTKNSFDWIIEIGFLPGVTDNVANTAQECIQDLFNLKFFL